MDEFHQIVLIGGGSVGKSCVAVRFLQDKYISDYDPTIEETYRKMVIVDNEPCVLEILDTAGQEEFRGVREKYYRIGEAFLLIYSIVSRTSFYEAKQIYERLQFIRNDSDIPLILVGNKADLVEHRVIEQQEGKELAETCNTQLVETSAKEGSNIHDAFILLVRKLRHFKSLLRSKNQQEIIKQKEERKKFCSLL